jgi:hypothetical protein
MLAKYLVDILAKRLAKYLADILPALEETRDIVGLVVPSIAIIMLLKPADPLNDIKRRNILLIGLGILTKYIYNILIIIAT